MGDIILIQDSDLELTPRDIPSMLIAKKELDVPFNRLIIQQCAPYSLHGYNMTNFPDGKFRTSVATYAYQIHENLIETPRTTDWFPNNDASFLKKQLAKNYNFLVQTKNKFFGSGTAKNQ